MHGGDDVHWDGREHRDTFFVFSLLGRVLAFQYTGTQEKAQEILFSAPKKGEKGQLLSCPREKAWYNRSIELDRNKEREQT